MILGTTAILKTVALIAVVSAFIWMDAQLLALRLRTKLGMGFRRTMLQNGLVRRLPKR